jgi:hypothetical protein
VSFNNAFDEPQQIFQQASKTFQQTAGELQRHFKPSEQSAFS